MSRNLTREQWATSRPGLPYRYKGFLKRGTTGNRVQPTNYQGYGGDFEPTPPAGAIDANLYPHVDVPNIAAIHHVLSNASGSAPSARNKAWESMMESIRSESASLGVALGEAGKSAEMIARRAGQLRRGFSALRRGRFRQFTRELEIVPKRRDRNRVSNSVQGASSLWLEYSYGWKILVSDIYSGCLVLSQPLPHGEHSGSGRETYQYASRRRPAQTLEYWKGVTFVKQGCKAFVVNPNLYLAQQAGLANPASVAWDLVPFSFLVDWVFDVQVVIDSWTDLLGIEVQDPYTTTFRRFNGYYERYSTGSQPRNKYRYGSGWVVVRDKRLSRPAPNTQFTANIGQSVTRAANAVALLGQILTK